MSKVEFIKSLDKQTIINHVSLIFNKCKTLQEESKERWNTYNEILKQVFNDKSKLAIFMLVFFDSCKLEEIKEKLGNQDSMMESIKKGEKKLKLKIIN